MSAYTLPDLLKHWQSGEMTAEQATPKGHPHRRQHLVALAHRSAKRKNGSVSWNRPVRGN